ncbi:MAG TPA: hypothetical protein VHJ57_01965, partial [Nitrososphaeraceae archaeon]|nr:hypothetical protein [Nitrososphaeraceae archaeon]
MNKIDYLIDSHMEDLISDLQILIRQPSVSARNNGVLECSLLVKNLMEKAGIKTELLFPQQKKDIVTDNNFNIEPKIDRHNLSPPIIYGEVQSKRNPQGKT